MAKPLPTVANLPDSSPDSLPKTFRISPLIRLTLLGLYLALTIPLPFLPSVALQERWLQIGLWLLLGLGLVALYAALSEQVIVQKEGIQVAYPRWVPPQFRQGWFLSWQEIKALKPRSTGQGGLVYYFVSENDRAYLLPMRVAGFARLVQHVQVRTGLDMTDVKPLSQPWMYLILLILTLMLLLVDLWTITTAIGITPITR